MEWSFGVGIPKFPSGWNPKIGPGMGNLGWEGSQNLLVKSFWEGRNPKIPMGLESQNSSLGEIWDGRNPKTPMGWNPKIPMEKSFGEEGSQNQPQDEKFGMGGIPKSPGEKIFGEVESQNSQGLEPQNSQGLESQNSRGKEFWGWDLKISPGMRNLGSIPRDFWGGIFGFWGFFGVLLWDLGAQTP